MFSKERQRSQTIHDDALAGEISRLRWRSFAAFLGSSSARFSHARDERRPLRFARNDGSAVVLLEAALRCLGKAITASLGESALLMTCYFVIASKSEAITFRQMRRAPCGK